MKKSLILFLSIILLTGLFNGSSWGQSGSLAPTSANSQQQIDELKSKIASKVAELKLVEKRGVLGTVVDASDTQIRLTDPQENIKIIDVDELTKFYSSSDSFGISDIKKGQTIGVLGLFNKDSRRILAREINDIEQPQKIIIGIIANIDKENYQLTLVNINKEKTIIEIENKTKTFSYANGELVKSGFSKIKNFETTIVTGFIDKQNPKILLGSKVILLENISLAKKINLSEIQNGKASSSAIIN